MTIEVDPSSTNEMETINTPKLHSYVSKGGVTLSLIGGKEAVEFKTILFRGINTMEDPPDWAVQLHDALNRVHEVKS